MDSSPAKKAHAVGGKDIERLIVVSTKPAYRVEALLAHGIA